MKARDNPFRTERVLAFRYRPCDVTWEQLLSRLESLGRRGAIVGPRGSGKTTLLEDLGARLATRGLAVRYVQLNREKRKLSPEDAAALRRLTGRDLVLLDGAEQLSWWRWWLVRRRTRRAGGLLITSHRPGLLPTVLETHASIDVLRQMVEELAGEVPADLAEVFARHRGNIRTAVRELYDRWARR